MPNNSSYTIETKGLVREFGNSRAVDDVNLFVKPGEIYGFLGPNGAGKSTVVRMLTTLLLPSSGTANVAGFDVVKSPTEVRLRIGAALQEAALDNKQTGRELLDLQGRLYGLNGSITKKRIDELLELVDIGSSVDRLIETYSGGMKRRLDLAAALIHNPAILFLDEPTTGLDPISRSKVWEEIRRINYELGMTIFLTTQYLDEADQLAHRVGIINHGKIVAEDKPDILKKSVGSDVILVTLKDRIDTAVELFSKLPLVKSVESHGDNLTVSVNNGAQAIGPIAIALNESRIPIDEITLRTPTLDDVFLHFTGLRLAEEAQAEEWKDL
ncbi:MAG: daunorubicin ABC transporter ATP-binding protein [Dehalococcoidia bacterium]|nr:daunorubicin ABC transporter ATP-binding protein [Dehalococcoidia bacterium]|tara:strand:- start:534 stop:1514 length:981 start_codon:yes stop_codon:yes gene_type:complete